MNSNNKQFLDAAREGNWEVMDSAIKSGASLEAKTRFIEETALHLACRLGYHNVLQGLLKQESIKNNLKEHMKERDIDNWTPLHSACSHNETGFKRFFAMINRDPDDDISIMSQSQGHIMAERTQKTLEILFDSQKHFDAESKFDINARDGEGKTALHMACRYSSVNVVTLLVENGAEVNVKDAFHNTPLMEACRHQSEDVIVFLLGQSAEVNVKNKHNSSPLTLACQYLKEENAAVVKHLLDANADCDWADDDNDTPLILASKFGKTVMVREILKHKHKPKDLSKKNKKGESAWKCAISNEKARDELVPLLLNGGCTIDKQDASILFPRQTTESFSGDDLKQSVWLKIIRGMLLECNQPTGTNLSVTIKPLLRYASKEEKVFATIGAESEAHFEILYEATKELGLHENISKLIRAFQKDMKPEQRAEMLEDMIWREFSDVDPHEMYEFLVRRGLPRTPLQFSAMHGDYMLVWYLLKTSQFGGSDDIRRAMEIAKGKRPPGGTTRVKPESNSQPKKDSRKQHREKDSKRYKRTINMLQNAAAISSLPKQPPKKLPTRPKTEEMQDKEPHLQKHNATVVDFYKRERGEDGPVKLLRASPSVFDLVYANTRVDDIMKTAKTTFNEMVIVTRNNDMNDERKPQLRWIHLPANNVSFSQHIMTCLLTYVLDGLDGGSLPLKCQHLCSNLD
jgi:ankyrin repeat protein